MERKHIRLRRDELLRLKYLKYEHTRIILQSIKCTQALPPIMRFYAYFKLYKHNFFASRCKNYCLLTGRGRGTLTVFNLSRHSLNKYAQFGNVCGFTRNNYR